ncbi:MAG: heme o synthase [Pseudomonadota bacterium]
MTAAALADIRARAPEAGLNDYFRLLKPRVMALVVFTALAAMLAAPASEHPVVAFAALLCISVGAGAAGALNMWYDADIDAAMQRTSARPVPQGVVEPGEALGLGLGLALISVTMLAVFTNALAAGLLAFTIFFYAVVYTMWLKRATAQNIVIGGAAGAFPPMIAWIAVSGGLTVEPVLMFMVIFLWTPPHFWALALFRRDYYAGVGMPMLPVVAGDRVTRRQMLAYTLLLTPVAVAPAFTASGGPFYLAVSLWVSARFLFAAWRVAERDEAEAAADSFAVEKRMFGISITYLFALFGALIGDALLTALFGRLDWLVWI